jgi:hypothetical protein
MEPTAPFAETPILLALGSSVHVFESLRSIRRSWSAMQKLGLKSRQRAVQRVTSIYLSPVAPSNMEVCW